MDVVVYLPRELHVCHLLDATLLCIPMCTQKERGEDVELDKISIVDGWCRVSRAISLGTLACLVSIMTSSRLFCWSLLTCHDFVIDVEVKLYRLLWLGYDGEFTFRGSQSSYQRSTPLTHVIRHVLMFQNDDDRCGDGSSWFVCGEKSAMAIWFVHVYHDWTALFGTWVMSHETRQGLIRNAKVVQTSDFIPDHPYLAI